MLETVSGKVKELNEYYCPLIITLTVWPEFLKAALYKKSK